MWWFCARLQGKHSHCFSQRFQYKYLQESPIYLQIATLVRVSGIQLQKFNANLNYCPTYINKSMLARAQCTVTHVPTQHVNHGAGRPGPGQSASSSAPSGRSRQNASALSGSDKKHALISRTPSAMANRLQRGNRTPCHGWIPRTFTSASSCQS